MILHREHGYAWRAPSSAHRDPRARPLDRFTTTLHCISVRPARGSGAAFVFSKVYWIRVACFRFFDVCAAAQSRFLTGLWPGQSGIIKLSRLQPACAVYRGIRGMKVSNAAELAQKLGRLRPFMVVLVFPRECVGQPGSFGPT